jgi:glycosyltransferase involved in cell wall biosynthesis
LEELSKGYPIEFKKNINESQLRQVYLKSKIFFHAKGYGINENKTPQLAEHFGMVTVEAMGYGCVPITVRRGGQKEIVRENKDGFLYLTQEEAIRSLLLIMQNEELRKKLYKESMERAKYFSLKNFQKNLDNIIKEVLPKNGE